MEQEIKETPMTIKVKVVVSRGPDGLKWKFKDDDVRKAIQAEVEDRLKTIDQLAKMLRIKV